MIKLYHGSNVEIDNIDLSLGHQNKDFGKGFYLTSLRNQAQEMAIRKCRFSQKGSPIVAEFRFDDAALSDDNVKVKVFESVSTEWAQFILQNRKSSETGFAHNYDIVVGPVANDGVVVQLNLFEQQFITLEELVNRLKFRDLNNQYFFGTEKSLHYLKKI